MAPAGQFGRLPIPMRIGVRVKPWKLKRHSSPADGARAEGFGVPVMLAASASPGAAAPEAGKGGGSPPPMSAAGAAAPGAAAAGAAGAPDPGAGGGNPPVAGAAAAGDAAGSGGGVEGDAAAVWACPVRDTRARAPASRMHRGVARIAIPLLEWTLGAVVARL